MLIWILCTCNYRMISLFVYYTAYIIYVQWISFFFLGDKRLDIYTEIMYITINGWGLWKGPY